MSTPLTLFTTFSGIDQVDPCFLTQFLQSFSHCLTPQAAALLVKSESLEHTEFCNTWAAQFRHADAFAPPLPQVLRAIETLARPENDHLIERVASNLPSGYAICRANGPLRQALHVWLLQGLPGVTFPIPVEAPEPTPQNSQPSGAQLSSDSSSAQNSAGSPTEVAVGAAISPGQPEIPAGMATVPASPDSARVEAGVSPKSLPADGRASPDSPPAQTGPQASNLHAPTLQSLERSEIPTGRDTLSPSAETDAQAFARLARLSPVDYDHARRAEAKRLGLRLRTLDDAVDAARIREDDAAAAAIHLSLIQPWHEPITDAPALFDEVRQRVLLYLSLVPGADVVLTVWPAHAHAIAAFNISPRLNLTSSETGCGKSTALDLLNVLTPKVLRTDSLKTAVLFRVVDRHQPTLLLDELDSYLHLFPDLRGLLNAGNKLGGCAHRCEGPHVRAFKAFAATALAGIGHLAPTLRDRSIVINMLKAEQGALQARLDERYLETEKLLGRKIARWVQDNFAAIAACDPVMPPAAYNRLGDKWRPLFAIAQTIGGHWPQLILDAFHALSQNNNSNNHTSISALIQDIRQIFSNTGATRLFSRTLVDALNALPSRPWSHLLPSNKHNARLTEVRLARYLAPHGIVPRLVRIGPRRGKAYDLADFPHSPSTPSPNANGNGNAGHP